MRRKLIFYLVVFILAVISLIIVKSVTSQSLDIDLLRTQQIIPWGVKSVNAPSIWAKTTGKGIKIAILDSGIDFQHTDLGSNIKQGYNAIEPNTLPNDDYGHGTLVAGIIAAKNNSVGVVGVAPDAEIYPVKVLDKYGEGDISDVARGIDWCIANKIQIINMSFAIEDDKPLLRSSIQNAIDAGIIIVASASNTFGGKVGYPASYEQVISVTSVDKKKRLSKEPPSGKIDFSAPGIGIISTAIDGTYAEFSGNSLAAPHVTGCIALMLENPLKYGLSNDKKKLVTSVFGVLKNLSINLGNKKLYGEGFIQMNN